MNCKMLLVVTCVMMARLWLITALLASPIFSSVTTDEFDDVKDATPKIAIIGGGIGGTSTAFFIKKALPRSQVDVFEKGDVGGRLRTTKIAGREYEVGGSVIHPKNEYMTNFLEVCNLTKATRGPSKKTSIYHHGELVVELSDWSSWSTIQLLWRYGFISLLRLRGFVHDMLWHFKQVYPKLDHGQTYNNALDLLNDMYPSSSYPSLLTESLHSALKHAGINELLINELGRIATRVNYGQLPEAIHAFVGSVAIAGTQGELWAVKGGNYRIPECLLEVSNARKIEKLVKKVEKGSEGGYLVDGEKYDMVVIASPQTSDEPSRLDLGSLAPKNGFEGSYHRTVANIVHGTLRKSVFTSQENFILDADSNVISVASLVPTDYDPSKDADINALPSVYKVFSKQPLSDQELNRIFDKPADLFINGERTKLEVQVFDWQAYPEYSVGQPMQDFVLGEGLFYLNAIEKAASAMEMSSLAGRNVANLVVAHARKSLMGEVSTSTGFRVVDATEEL